jgi:hypothetical protein
MIGVFAGGLVLGMLGTLAAAWALLSATLADTERRSGAEGWGE